MTPAAAEQRHAGATVPEGAVQLPFTPRAHQREAHALRLVCRFIVLVWHRRAGKTVWAIVELILAAATFRREGGRFGYICPLLKQAKEVAWDYLVRYSRVIPGTTVNQAELSVTFRNGARIRLYGADNPDAIRGGYFDGLVIDETGQVKRALWLEVIRPMLADRHGWCVFLGTPKGVNLFSELYFAAVSGKAGEDWGHDLKRWDQTDALDPAEVEAARRAMSPQLFAQEFECDFFAAQENVLLSLEDVLTSMRRDLKRSAFDWAAKVLGVDVARYGDDESTIAKRQGLVAFRIERHRGLNTMELASRVAWVIEDEKADACFVDVSGGLGAGPYDRLCQLQVNCTLIPVEFGGKADDPRYANKRTEMFVRMADWTRGGGCLPDDVKLQQELVAHTYDFDAQSRMRLCPKDDVKERLGRSPDGADGLACTFHTNIAPRNRDVLPGTRAAFGGSLSEYDPYAVA
jgi:hypothetical protein